MDGATNENIAVLKSVCSGEQAKAILAFAEKNGLVNGRIHDYVGNEHCAAEYAVHLYSNAYEIDRDLATDEDTQDALLTVCLMLALEQSCFSRWSSGAELLYKIRQAGIVLKRQVVSAFAAQLGTSKEDDLRRRKLMRGSHLATAVYCARLVALGGTLVGTYSPHSRKETPKEIADKFNWGDVKQSTAEQGIRNVMTDFVPALLGEDSQKSLTMLLGALRKKGFFALPVKGNEDLAFSGGLAVHVTLLIARHIDLLAPQTEAEVGRIVLTDVCSYLYAFDPLYLGDGLDNLHKANSFFGSSLPQDVAVAISATEPVSGMTGTLVANNPLTLTRYVADIMATMLDAPGWTYSKTENNK